MILTCTGLLDEKKIASISLSVLNKSVIAIIEATVIIIAVKEAFLESLNHLIVLIAKIQESTQKYLQRL